MIGQRVFRSPGRHRTVRVLADRRPWLEAEAAGHRHLANPAAVNELDRVDDRGPAAVHRADLHDPVVVCRGLDHLPAFPHGVRGGLLDVYVLAGLQRPDRGERVPVIRRGDDNRVDVLVVEDAPKVLRELRLERRHVLQPRIVDALGGEVPVDVAQHLVLHVLQTGEAALERVALPADSDAGDHDAIVGADHPLGGGRRRVGDRFQAPGADGHPRRGGAQPRRELAT